MNEEKRPARRSRRWIGAALLVVLVWTLGAGPLGAFLGRLGEVQTNDRAAFLPVGAESTEAARLAEDFDRGDAVPAIAVWSGEADLTEADLAAVAAVGERVAAEPWVSGDVIGPFPGTEDPSVAQLVVPVDSAYKTSDAVEELRAILADHPVGDLTAQVTGPAGYAADLVAAFAGIDSTLLLVAVSAVLVILVAVYRSPLLPVLVILASLLALGLSGFLVYLAADTGLVSLNGQSQGILFILVVGACTDYALLLVARHREELARHERVPAAVLAALRGVAGPVLASAGTVVLGLLCLLAADLASTRSLGPVVAIGVGAAVLSAMTFLPAALALVGRAAFWPSAPHRPAADTAAATDTVGGTAGDVDRVMAAHPLWGRIARTVARRPRTLWLATTALLAAAAVFAPAFSAQGTGQAEVFRTEVEAVTAQEVLDRGFGTDAAAAPALVVADADHLVAVVAAAESSPTVESAAPVTEPGPPGVDLPPLTEDGRVLVEAVLTVGPESPEAVDAVRELRERLAEDAPDAGALVGGV
ncbi:MMPL family transporter, partial [Nocardiopsis protaetiae]